MLNMAIPDLDGNSYLHSPYIRNKIVGYLLGIESWHMILFGKISQNSNLSFLFASLIVAYDNAVDEEILKENDWENFETFLNNPVSNVKVDTKKAIGAAETLIITIKKTEPVFWENAKKYFILIHNATRESFIQSTKDSTDEEKLRKSSYDKGGYAFLLWTLIKNDSFVEKYHDIIYRFGAAVQVADDIYDRREDTALGQCSIASYNFIQKKERELIYEVAENLPRQSGAFPHIMLAAWKIHLKDSLKYYDSGKLSGRWKYSIGQNLFEFGVKVMPFIPSFVFQNRKKFLGNIFFPSRPKTD